MLQEVKTYLCITWEDEDLDRRVTELIEQSKAALLNLTDAQLDFNSDKEARELLFNRIRYAYNNAIEYFESNFASEILRMQLREGVKKLEK